MRRNSYFESEQEEREEEYTYSWRKKETYDKDADSEYVSSFSKRKRKEKQSDSRKREEEKTRSFSYSSDEELGGSYTVSTRKRKNKKGLVLAAVAAVAVLAGVGSMLGSEEDYPAPDDSGQTIVFPTPDNDFEVDDDWGFDVLPDIEPEVQETRYFKRQLNTQYWDEYDKILKGLQNHDASIEGLYAASYEDFDDIVEAVRSDYADLFYFRGGYSYTYSDKGSHIEYTLKPVYRWEKEVSMVNALFVENHTRGFISANQGKSDYEKVKAVYEYLIDNTAYDYAYTGESLYELFYYKGAVCDAYARAAQYLLTKLGVETIYVTGHSTRGEGHAWNIVLVEGEYYQIDVTWGDPYDEENHTQTKNFNYLCLTDEDMARDHITDWSRYPACTSRKYNYYVQEDRYLEYYDTEKICQWFGEMSGPGDKLVFKCANEAVYNEARQKLITEKQVFKLMERVYSRMMPYKSYGIDAQYIIGLEWCE